MKVKMPNDWKCGLLIKIPKKGDTANCDNWRGITLLSIPSKVFTRILLNRIREHVNYRLQREQAGFRPNRSCIDQINTLWIIIEQCVEWLSRLYAVFIDFEKAFDSVNREAMWKEVKSYGVPKQLINLIKETYRGYMCQVVHEGCVSEPFPVRARVRQGCILSPLMFSIVIDVVMRNVNRDRRRGIRWGLVDRLENLDFADDSCLLSEAYREMQAKLGDLTQEVRKVGQAINVKKTKALRINEQKKNCLGSGTKISRMWKVLYIWVVRLPKMEGPCRTWCTEFIKQMVLFYNFTQYGGIIRYRLGPNSASSVAM